MAEIITVQDLPASIRQDELAQLMVDGANAVASRVAPCLASADPAPSAEQTSEARLVLVGAVKRWADAGAGAFQSQSAGPFSVALDTRQRTGFNLWPSEITGLQELCRGPSSGRRAFEVDTAASAVAGYWSAPDTWTPIAP